MANPEDHPTMPESEPRDPFKNNVPGSTFSRERGKLYRFRPGLVVVIRPWPNPQAWAKRDAGNWTAARAKIDLSASSDAHEPASWIGVAEMDCFKELIPQDVIQAVLGAHLHDHQWEALQLIARVPGARELMAEIPLLAAALSCSHKLKPRPVQRPLRSARALLRNGPGMKTWRRISAWLGFPGSRSFVQTLRRVVIAHDWPWALEQVQRLRSLWAIPAARKRIRHCKQLDQNSIDLVFFARTFGVLDRVHPNLIEGAFNAGVTTTAPGCLRDVAESWPVVRPGRQLPLLRTVEELEDLREDLRQEIEARFLVAEVREEPSDFPPPPLPPTPQIRPLDSAAALNDESARMMNCLDKDYWTRDSCRRWGFAYAVDLDGESADVWVEPVRKPGTEGLFTAREIRGPKNAAPSARCVQLVNRWIGEHHRRVLNSSTPLDQVPMAWRSAWTERPSLARPHPPQLAWALDICPF